MTAVDTNVLLDIVDGSPFEAAAAIASLQASIPPLVVSAAASAELRAHAGTLGTLVPRDGRSYERNFPGLRVVSPAAA